jgi:hypothetical protein
MAQHASWVSYSGSSRIVLAIILLIVAAAVAGAGARLSRPATLPRPGRITTYVLLTVWVVVIFAFLSVLSVLTQQAQQAHPGRVRATGPGPIAPVTYTAVVVTFVVIIALGRAYDWPARLGGAAIGALAAPMIFEFPFDFIVLTRISPISTGHLVLFFVPLFLIEIITLTLLAASPMVRLRRSTFFCFASILVVFAIWALYGFGYPNTSLFYSLNVVSKLLAFATALTLFLPQRARAAAAPPAETNVPTPPPARRNPQPRPCWPAKALSSFFCSAKSAVVGLTITRVTPSAVRAARSSGVIAVLAQRVYSSASASRPAARALSRIRASWAVRCSSLIPPPGKYPSPRSPARRAAAELDPPTWMGSV